MKKNRCQGAIVVVTFLGPSQLVLFNLINGKAGRLVGLADCYAAIALADNATFLLAVNRTWHVKYEYKSHTVKMYPPVILQIALHKGHSDSLPCLDMLFKIEIFESLQTATRTPHAPCFLSFLQIVQFSPRSWNSVWPLICPNSWCFLLLVWQVFW